MTQNARSAPVRSRPMRFGIFYEHQLPRPVGGGRRAPALQGRARPDRARRPRRLRLRLGGRAPLPRGVLALERLRRLPRRRQPADEEHPARLRDPSDAAGLPAPRARGRDRRDARPRLRRPRRVRQRRDVERRRARRLRRRARDQARAVGRGARRRHAHVRRGAVRRHRRPLRHDAAAQRRPQAAAEAAPAAVGRVLRRETIRLAAEKGIGALSFSFVEPEEAKEWVDEYYAIIASDRCVPAGFAVNPNVAVVLPMMVAEDEAEAIERGIDGGALLRLLADALLRLRRAPPGPDVDLGGVPRAPRRGRLRALDHHPRQGAARREDPPAGPRLAARRGRDARPGPRPRRPLRGGGRRPDDLRPAGRDEPARAHLRGDRAVRQATSSPSSPGGATSASAKKAERLAPAVEAALARREPAAHDRPRLRHRAARQRPARRRVGAGIDAVVERRAGARRCATG